MRRALPLAAALAVMVLAPAGAAAETVVPAGEAKGSPFGVALTVITQNGKPVAVRKVGFTSLPITCDQGDYLLSANIKGTVPVNNNRFRGVATTPDPPGKVKVKGKFANPSKVRGRVKAEGTFEGPGGGDITGCAGSRRYTAS